MAELRVAKLRASNGTRMEIAQALRAHGVRAKELTQLRVTAPSRKQVEGVYDLLDERRKGAPVWGCGDSRIYIEEFQDQDSGLYTSVWCISRTHSYKRLDVDLLDVLDVDVCGKKTTPADEMCWRTPPGFDREEDVKVTWAQPDISTMRFAEFQQINARRAVTENVGQLLGDTAHSDFTVVLKGGVEVAAHRCIMSARCGIAAAIIRNGERAPSGNQLVIDDLDPAAGRSLLQFIYTGQLDADALRAEDLAAMHSVADKYNVAGFAAEALDQLRASLRRNPAEVWDALALRLSSGEAVTCCLECVAGLGKSDAALAAAREFAASGHTLAAAAAIALRTGKVDADFITGAKVGGGEPAAKRRRGD